jgi:polyhydroxyalkanoate synthesis regulator phasin
MGERPEWVEEIVRGIADLSARLERVETELPRLRGDLMARMDHLQDRLSQMIEDVGVNFASADRAVRSARAQRDEMVSLEEQVSALTRLVHKLQADIRALRGET